MKHGQILIDIENNMSSVSLLEDGRLNEYYVEYGGSKQLTGNIYKGRVVNVLQGLQTAFVDIGLSRNAFLYVGETLDDRSDLRKSGVIPNELNIKAGDYVMVQVTKEEVGAKGARLSMNISLPGRLIVYLPTINFVGISNKITDEKTREKILKNLEDFKAPNEGFIARTNCLEAKKSEILQEATQMKELFKEISDGFEKAGGVAIIHSEGNLLFRSIRDMLSNNIESIICNDFETVEKLKRDFKRQKSRFYDLVQYYQSNYDILDVFGLSSELDKLLDRKVELVSGGSLIIDKTEALTVIDVNTAKYKGFQDHEETVFMTNLEAAKEIARQLRLRNIGGIIVVDFIDMFLEEHKTAVVDELKKELVFDRIKTRVLDMTGLGLVEITRKKVGNELQEYLLDECPICNGSAHTHSARYMSRKIKSGLKRLFADNNFSSAIISLSPSYVDTIIASRIFAYECENQWVAKRIYLVPKENMRLNEMTVSGSNAVYLNLPQNAKLLY